MSKPFQRRSISWTLALSVLLVALMAAAAFGLAGTLRLSGSRDDSLGKTIVVNPDGRTLYSLSGESATHLLCKGACLSVWPPVTVPRRSEKIVLGGGARGKIGLLRRPDGVLQVTLRGVPVYRYSGDRARGETNGEGIEADGGTWHALSAAPAPAVSSPSKTPSAPYTY